MNISLAGDICFAATECVGKVNMVCKKGRCTCFAGLGFEGKDCDQPTAQSTYNQIGNTFQTLYTVVLFFYCCYFLYRIRLLQQKQKDLSVSNKKLKRTSKLYWVVGFALAASVASFIYSLFRCILAYNPSFGVFLELKGANENDFVVIAPPGGPLAQFTIAIAFLFIVSASIVIALSLIEVSENLKTFSDHSKFITFVGFFKKFSMVLLPMLFIIQLSLTIANQIRISQLIMLIILLLIGLLFLFGRISFVFIINGMASSSKANAAEAISLVTTTTTVHSIFTLIMGFFSGAEFFAFTSAGKIKAGEFHYLVFFRDAFTFSALVVVTCNLWYTTRLLRNMEDAQRTLGVKAYFQSKEVDSTA